METDNSNMRQVIMDSPRQLEEGLALAKDVTVTGDFKNLIVCGMGGSALAADILKSLGLVNRMWVHRDYGLSSAADENSLIVCISYSGNTEETVSALQEALKKNLKAVCMASGGEIENIATQNNLPFIKLPAGIQPRSAIGYMFSALATIAHKAGFTDDKSSEIMETKTALEGLLTETEETGKKLAKKLHKKIPVVYAAGLAHAVSMARIWKIKFNENAKIPSFYNYFPELNHNEMVGFSSVDVTSNFHFIILKDQDDHPRNVKRMELFASLMKKQGLETDTIEIHNGSPLLKIFSTLLVGDWTSYYVALENSIDPTPVTMVEKFKKLLS